MHDRGRWLVLGAVLGALGVAAGAFGAHGLRGLVEPELIETWNTAARYHLVHAVAILALAAGDRRLFAGPWAGRACIAWAVGVLVFSGSLYALTLTGLRALGALTPVGGLAFIAGWMLVVPAARALGARDSTGDAL